MFWRVCGLGGLLFRVWSLMVLGLRLELLSLVAVVLVLIACVDALWCVGGC